MKIEFYKHNISEEDIREVTGTLQSVFLTTGPKTRLFEEKFASFLGVPYVVGVTSCTAGLFLVLKSFGIGVGDEVVTTPMSFIATSNSILHTGAKPVFVDVEPSTGNLDAGQIENAITTKTKAIICVHLYGQMCDLLQIRKIADKHGLLVIEDCAHCIEGVRDGIRVGQLSDAAVFSFYATKNLTSGEGGAIATNNAAIAGKIKRLRLHGMSESAVDRYSSKYQHWDMLELGYKFNMFDIQAALLINQLYRLGEYRRRKENICRSYEGAFVKRDGIDFPKVLPNSVSDRHLFTIWVASERRDFILSGLQEMGIGVAVNFRAVHLLKFYRDTFGYKPGDFPVAEKIGNCTITLPLYPKLTSDEIEHIIKAVEQLSG